MIRLQLATSMRPGEVYAMRTGDLDTTGDVWLYTPADYKTSHQGRGRTIYIGPKGQDVLRDDPLAPLFQPREASAERLAATRKARKTRGQPSQADRRKARPSRKPGDRYRPSSYAHAVATDCKNAGVHHWHPNRLRHNAGTRRRSEFGLDIAKTVHGHSTPAAVEVYAEIDMGRPATP